MKDDRTIAEEMPGLLDCCGGEPMQYFSKKSYAASFQQMYQEYVSVFDAIENGYHAAADKEQFLTGAADALAGYAAGQVNACRGKSRKERQLMDLNLTMAAFVFPMVLEYHGNSSEPLARQLLVSWKREFPKTNLQIADFVTIEQGFHKKYCYITTAVCRVFGKPDNCYELTLLRDFRDNYLAKESGGGQLIDRYYDVAPSIVKHIDQHSDAAGIYRSIWERWLLPCIRLIEEGRPDACREVYAEMVYTLQEQYFRRA